MILAGDVGGTKVHLALFDFVDGKLEHSRDKQYLAKQYSGLEDIVREFMGGDKVSAACFGVPGPVREGRLRLRAVVSATPRRIAALCGFVGERVCAGESGGGGGARHTRSRE